MVILVVEDDTLTRKIVLEAITQAGHRGIEARDGDEGWQLFRENAEIDVAISDWFMPGVDGLELCRRIRKHDRETYTYFVLLTVASGRENMLKAMEEGADDFLTKPLDPGELEIRLLVARRVTNLRQKVIHASQRLTLLEEQNRSRVAFEGMVGKAPAMQEVFRRIRLAAQSDVSIFVHGPSGTGKELAAGAIHTLSSRRDQSFITVNCAAIPDSILESELFGHRKGAFTDAHRDKPGLLELAHEGTVFLDEIGDISPLLQKKLLRALEEKQVRRVGDERPRPIDVRIVTATNRDLLELVDSGEFRDDLYYRIRVFQIDLPALTERREDIPLLVDHFVRELAGRAGKSVTEVEPGALRSLMDYPWPGNIRELRNAIEHALVITEGPALALCDFPPEIREGARPAARTRRDRSSEAEEVIRAVIDSEGNRTEAARRLGISRVALWKKIRRLGVEDRLPPSSRSRSK